MSSFIIGVTGPMGAGKTTLCESFREQGILIIDADGISKEVFNNSPEYVELLTKEFGSEILTDGRVDRKSLADIAFLSKENAQRLNRIAHPFIVKRIKEKLEEAKAQKIKVIAIDAPLLFESSLDRYCNVVVTVISDLKVRKFRAINRGNIRKEDVINRISIQPTDEFYVKNSDYVLYNRDKEALCEQARSLVAEVMEKFNEE